MLKEEETMKRMGIRLSAWLAAFLVGSALTLAMAIPSQATEYPHGTTHGDVGHHGKGSSSHGMSHPGTGHGSGLGHHGTGSRHGMGARHGAHQNASDFIKHVLKFKDGMAITQDQERRLKAINITYKKTRIKMKAEVKLANLDLHETLKNETSSLSDIESQLKNVHALKADLYLASIKAKREAKGVLTDEQRKRMKAVHDRIKGYGSKMMRSGHPGGYKHHGKGKDNDTY
jgi:Spy/CpxP family protein refolding chaperone